MQEPIKLTDSDLESVLAGEKPVLLLFSNGDDLRGDFDSAYKKAAPEHEDIVFARIVTRENPQAVEQFDIGSKPVLIGWGF